MSESVTVYADLASSKFVVLSAPINAPGICAVCGTSRTDDRQYVDFGLTVDYVGTIYFCSFCIQELCNRMGCLTQEQSKQLEDQLDAAKQEILSFQRQKVAYDDAIASLRATGLFDSDSNNLDVGVSQPVQDEPIIQSGSSKTSQGTDTKSSRANSKAKQSDPKQGSSDISTASGDGLTEFDGF